jgi:hypothetical protein
VVVEEVGEQVVVDLVLEVLVVVDLVPEEQVVVDLVPEEQVVVDLVPEAVVVDYYFVIKFFFLSIGLATFFGLSKMSLASRLTTMKKNMTSKFKPGAPKIADAQALYLSVLTSVAFPILGSNPSEGNVKSPKLHVKPNSNSIPKDNTIFVCLSSMNIAHQKIEERMLLMKDINTIEAKVFLQTGQRYCLGLYVEHWMKHLEYWIP